MKYISTHRVINGLRSHGPILSPLFGFVHRIMQTAVQSETAVNLSFIGIWKTLQDFFFPITKKVIVYTLYIDER